MGTQTILPTTTILPSNFTGGPRYMHQKTQDAMVYVRNYGRPHLFITFTTNPKWPEILSELFPGQSPEDRNDSVAPVFHLKHKKLMDLLTRGEVFGPVKCHMHSTEWQKRGLPHSHTLVCLEEGFRANQIDSIISAELPNPEEDPELFSIVTSQMIHGPCGNRNCRSPCMKDGKCSKGFPKPLVKETQTGQDSYPEYRRRSPDDGGFCHETKKGDDIIKVGNEWVVPHNPFLLKTFNAHLNVEFANSVKSIKYICKYVNKGSDQAIYNLSNAQRPDP